MNYVEYGKENSDVIILLHGGGLSWWNYKEVAERLQTDYHVVLPILDGHAGCDKQFTTIENNALDIIEFVNSKLGGSVLMMGGLSLGGQILLEILFQRKDICKYAIVESVLVIVFIDAVHFSVRDDGVIRKLAAYVVLGINEDGMKEVLSIVVGENESSKYWLSVLNSLKNRGVQDILILCSDGLTGIKDAISAAFPETEQQRCIVHMVRNTLKYVANKDMKSFAKDLKTIYTAADEEAARKQLKTVTEKWSGQYPSAMNRWHDNWDAISPIFKFSKEVRTAFYTTNAIESLNSCYRRLNKQRSVFPSSQALLKALYLGTFEIAKKWTMPIRNWGKVRGELEIMYPDRMQI